MKRQPGEKQKSETRWRMNNFNHNFKQDGRSLTLWRLRIGVVKHLVLVTEHVIVDVEFVCNGTLEESERNQKHFLRSITTSPARKHQNILIKPSHLHEKSVSSLTEVSYKPRVPAQTSAWISSWAACCWTARPSPAPQRPRSGWRGRPRAWSWCDNHGNSEPSPSCGSPVKKKKGWVEAE